MSITLSSREKKIIDCIIKSLKPLTIQSIATEIEVSRRTILRDIHTVYRWFETHGYPLKKAQKSGLFLDVPESRRLYLLDQLNHTLIDYYYTPKERQVFIATELLQANDLTKLFYFSDLLQVSEATISHDLDTVETWFDKYDLHLERKPGYGLEVVGSESNKRKALMKFIHDSLDGEQLKDVIKNYVNVVPNNLKSSIDIRKKLLNLIDLDTVKVIEKAISQSEEDMGFKFQESSYTALAVHLVLALQRLIQGETITIDASVYENLMLYDEFHIAKKLTEHIGQLLDLTIPPSEIGYVTMHLRGAKYNSGLHNQGILKFNELIVSNYQLASIINEMIRIAEKNTGYRLRDSDSLLVGLVEHLRPAINRLHMNLDIRNPLLSRIKEQYPDLFEISKTCAQVIEQRLNMVMPESEVGYITMHIGSAIERIKNMNQSSKETYRIIVTCMSGIGTSRMLAELIKSEFQNIDIVEVFASTNISETWLLENHIDLIVSTVHFENRLLPVITVNPLLLDNDIEKIKQKLSSLKILSAGTPHADTTTDHKSKLLQLHATTKSVIEVLDEFTIIDDLSFDTFDALLHFVCKHMTEKDKDIGVLSKEIRAREAIGSIIFETEDILFLHTRTQTRNTIALSVFRLSKPVQYNTHTVSLVLVILAPVDAIKEQIDVISQISTKLVSDDGLLGALKTLESDALYTQIQNIFMRYLNDKNKTLLGQ